MLRNDGMAPLFVTHFLDQVYAVSDRITVLRNGSLVGEYLAADLPRLKLISAMLGREFEEMKRIEKEAIAQADAPKKPRVPIESTHEGACLGS